MCIGEDIERTECSYTADGSVEQYMALQSCLSVLINQSSWVRWDTSAHYHKLGGVNNASFRQFWRVRSLRRRGQHILPREGHFLAHSWLINYC